MPLAYQDGQPLFISHHTHIVVVFPRGKIHLAEPIPVALGLPRDRSREVHLAEALQAANVNGCAILGRGPQPPVALSPPRWPIWDLDELNAAGALQSQD
jgi:hypothetical protein